MRDQGLRQDAIAIFQGLTGMWQIFCRQDSIPPARADAALSALLAPFAGLKTNRELFDAGRLGLTSLLASGATPVVARTVQPAAGAIPTGPLPPGPIQEGVMTLLAGGSRPEDSEIRTELIRQQQRYFDAQALFSPDTIFELADNLEAVAKGGNLNAQLAARLAARAKDIQMPRRR